MHRQFFILQALLFVPAVLLLSVPASAVTITVNSSTNLAGIPEPGQTLDYAGGAAIVTPTQSFQLGQFASVTEPSQTTITPTFSLTLTESVDANPLAFTGTVILGGTQASPADTIFFAGTGTETFNGQVYATITDGGYVYGVLQSNPVNFGKGIVLTGLIGTATPEPSTYFLSGLGFAGLAVAVWRRRVGVKHT